MIDFIAYIVIWLIKSNKCEFVSYSVINNSTRIMSTAFVSWCIMARILTVDNGAQPFAGFIGRFACVAAAQSSEQRRSPREHRSLRGDVTVADKDSKPHSTSQSMKATSPSRSSSFATAPTDGPRAPSQCSKARTRSRPCFRTRRPPTQLSCAALRAVPVAQQRAGGRDGGGERARGAPGCLLERPVCNRVGQQSAEEDNCSRWACRSSRVTVNRPESVGGVSKELVL